MKNKKYVQIFQRLDGSHRHEVKQKESIFSPNGFLLDKGDDTLHFKKGRLMHPIVRYLHDFS